MPYNVACLVLFKYLEVLVVFVHYFAVHSIPFSCWLLFGSFLYKEEPSIVFCLCCAWELDGHVVCAA